MNILYIAFLLLSLSFFMGCDEKKTEQDVTKEAPSKETSTKKVSSTVTIDGETSNFPYAQNQCMNPFNKGITAIVSNDKMMFELGENSKTETWSIHYIILGTHEHIYYSSISLDMVNENNVLKGTALVKQNNKPEITHNITFRIDCTKDLK